jgi:hypothetical protein
MSVTGSFIEPVQSTPRTPLKCYRNRPIVRPTTRSSRWYASSFAVRSVCFISLFHLIEPFYKSGCNYSTPHYAFFSTLVSLLTSTPHILSTRFPNTLIPILQHTCLNMRHFIIFPTPCTSVFRIQGKQRLYPQSIDRVLSIVVTQYVCGRNNF